MTQTSKQDEKEYRDLGVNQEDIAIAARNLGKLRAMNAEEIEANIAALKHEVIRHLQVEIALQQMRYGV